VKKQGYLTKRGGWRKSHEANSKKHYKTWKKRYFVLTSTCQLAYFKNEQTAEKGKPMGVLTIDGSSQVSGGYEYREMQAKELAIGYNDRTKLEKLKKKNKTYDTEFVVCGFEGSLFLRAPSKKEKEEWEHHVRIIVKRMQYQKSTSFQNLLAKSKWDDEISRKKPPGRLSVIKDEGEEYTDSPSSSTRRGSDPIPQRGSRSLGKGMSRSRSSINEMRRPSVSRPRRASISSARASISARAEEIEWQSMDDLIDVMLESTCTKTNEKVGGGKWMAFLIYTHGLYSSADGLMNKLIEKIRKTVEYPDVHSKILDFLSTWVDEKPDDFELMSENLLETMSMKIHKNVLQDFMMLSKNIKDVTNNHALRNLSLESTSLDDEMSMESLGKRESRNSNSQSKRGSGNEKKVGSHLKKFSPDLMDIRKHEAETICIQLVHVDLELVKTVDPRSFMKKRWKSKNANLICPELTHAIAIWNKRCYWVVSAILNEGMLKADSKSVVAEVASFLKQFIEIGYLCAKMGNFYSASVIKTALNMQCVKRIRPAWEKLKKDTHGKMQLLEKACCRKKYWERFDEDTLAGELHIPHLPLVLDALYQTEVKFSKDEGESKINMSKYRKQWHIIYSIIKYQRSELSKPKNENLMEALCSAAHWALTEDRLYEISYNIIPQRTSVSSKRSSYSGSK